jgi:KipI family sensor histidine kinase inhibitor
VGVFHVKHRWITDRGLRLESGDATLALNRLLGEARPEEVEALVPGDGSLLVVLRRGMAPGPTLLHLINGAIPDLEAGVGGQHHEIAVRYGGEAGPDLAEVAEQAGLTPGQAIELHAGATYQVAFLGFQPGFAYLSGTPKQLQAGRRDSPRPRIPAGSVALGGGYTGIYPGASAGGWQLIGRTDVWLFDPGRTPPARFAPGDRIRFVPA